MDPVIMALFFPEKLISDLLKYGALGKGEKIQVERQTHHPAHYLFYGYTLVGYK